MQSRGACRLEPRTHVQKRNPKRSHSHSARSGIHPVHQTPACVAALKARPNSSPGQRPGKFVPCKNVQALKGRPIHLRRTRFGRVGSPFQGWFSPIAMIPRALPWAFVARPVGAYLPPPPPRHQPKPLASLANTEKPPIELHRPCSESHFSTGRQTRKPLTDRTRHVESHNRIRTRITDHGVVMRISGTTYQDMVNTTAPRTVGRASGRLGASFVSLCENSNSDTHVLERLFSQK
jgi:hypothetical protein